ncbi:MAG: autotransporter assembly complex protein TamA [Thermodesulfobacteriota bacterium]
MFKLSLFFCCCLVLLCAPAFLQAQETSNQGLDYQPRLQGELSAEVREALISEADTFQLQEQLPSSRTQLEYRARQDVHRMSRALQSFGYFDPSIDFELQEARSGLEVVFKVQTGDRYVLGPVNLEAAAGEQGAGLELPEPEDLGLEPGSAFRARQVRQAERKIRQYLRNRGRPFPEASLQQALVDHKKQQVVVHYDIQPGPEADFGQTRIQGLDRVRKSYVQEFIPWSQGNLFQAEELEELRSKLVATGLFSMVQVQTAPELDEEGRAEIVVRLVERSPRTIKAGIGYETDIGPKLRLGWEHRNLRGKGRSLQTSLSVSPVEASLNAEFSIPRFKRQDQTLKLTSSLAREDTDAYESSSLGAEARVERQLSRHLSAGAGVAYRMLQVTQEEKDEFGLLSLPVSLEWDSRDQVLDPRQGIRSNLRLTPYTDTFNQDLQFLKTQLGVSHYQGLMQEERLLLASRAKLGIISGASRRSIPADERFYAGGGGSVRGYGFQKLGPLEDGDPVGGRSLLELGAELRWRVFGNSGLAAFLEGGQVYEDTYPSSEGQIRWGAGLGYRYHTGFGPLRLDLAVPLNKRPGVDSDFQIYISIGQAF